jgi:hypothetical protein
MFTDIEFDVHIAVTSKETSKSHKELKIEKDSPETNSATSNKNQSKKFANEICNINDEESTMSGNERVPPLTQNSRKFWSNNFDKRWKGVNSPRGRPNFSHRNSNDWYNQQYSDKDKLNNRNNFNHHNNHFNKLRHNIRGSYNNKSGENRNKEIKKEDADESLNLKNNIITSENTNDKNQSTQENGISNNVQSRKNDLSLHNDKFTIGNIKINDKESKTTEKELNLKKIVQNSSEEKLSKVEVCKENGNYNNITALEDNDVENNEKSMDEKLNDNDNLSTTKDCEITGCEKENCKSNSEEVKKEMGNKYNSDTTEKGIDSDTNSVCDGIGLESKQNSVENNCGLSSELKILKIASQKESVENKSKNFMEIYNNNENLCNNMDKNMNSDQISECDNAKDIVLELSENNIKNLNKICESEQQANNVNVFNNKKSSEAAELSEDTNHLLDDKSISQMKITEIEQIDSEGSQVINDEKNSKIMDVNDETEASILISFMDVKGSDSNDADKDEKISVESSLLDNIKSNSDLEKENNIATKINEVKEIQKQSKDLNITEEEEKLKSSETLEQEKINSVIEEVDLVDDEPEMDLALTSNEIQTDTSKTTDDATNSTAIDNKDTSQIVPISTADGNKVEESNEDGRAVVHKRRRRKRLSNIAYLEISSNEVQTGK